MGVFVTGAETCCFWALAVLFLGKTVMENPPAWHSSHNYWWKLKVQTHATASDVTPDLISIGCHKSLKTSFIVAFGSWTMCWCSAKRVRYPGKKTPQHFSSLFLFFITLSSPRFVLSFPLSSPVEMKDRHWGSGGQALAQLSNHYHSSFSSSPALTGHLSAGCRLWPLH